MNGYEELASYTSGDIRFNDSLLGLRFYEAKNTDKVIRAYEARIKELESDLSTKETSYEALIKNTVNVKNDVELRLQNRIKELEAEVEMDAKKRRIMVNGYNRKCERVKDLEATVSKMETTQKWISVKDRKPPKGQHVLVARNHLIRSLYPIDVVCWSEDYITHDIVTHWMLLPPPPTTEDSSATEKEK